MPKTKEGTGQIKKFSRWESSPVQVLVRALLDSIYCCKLSKTSEIDKLNQ